MGHNLGSDEEVQAIARGKIKAMMVQMPFLQRWMPVVEEMLLILAGRQNENGRKSPLPEYCLGILELYKRTLFRTMPPVFEAIRVKDAVKLAACKTFQEAKAFVHTDWEKLGSIMGSVLRTAQFFSRELDTECQKLGFSDLPQPELEEFAKLLADGPWLEELLAKIVALEPGKSVEEISEKAFNNNIDRMKNIGSAVEGLAFEFGPEALAGLKKGEARGASGFLDTHGNPKGEQKIKHRLTYLFLLTAWPEIDAMIKSDPPKRMEDLWNWLTPFSHAQFIEIEDLDQLVSLCRPIKLRLKKPGPPLKSQQC